MNAKSIKLSERRQTQERVPCSSTYGNVKSWQKSLWWQKSAEWPHWRKSRYRGWICFSQMLNLPPSEECPFICENPFPSSPPRGLCPMTLSPVLLVSHGWLKPESLSCSQWDRTILCCVGLTDWPRHSHMVSFLEPESQMPIACRVYSFYSMEFTTGLLRQETRNNVLFTAILPNSACACFLFGKGHLKLLGMYSTNVHEHLHVWGMVLNNRDGVMDKANQILHTLIPF